jgi:hypothetical protein
MPENPYPARSPVGSPAFRRGGLQTRGVTASGTPLEVRAVNIDPDDWHTRLSELAAHFGGDVHAPATTADGVVFFVSGIETKYGLFSGAVRAKYAGLRLQMSEVPVAGALVRRVKVTVTPAAQRSLEWRRQMWARFTTREAALALTFLICALCCGLMLWNHNKDQRAPWRTIAQAMVKNTEAARDVARQAAEAAWRRAQHIGKGADDEDD